MLHVNIIIVFNNVSVILSSLKKKTVNEYFSEK